MVADLAGVQTAAVSVASAAAALAAAEQAEAGKLGIYKGKTQINFKSPENFGGIFLLCNDVIIL